MWIVQEHETKANLVGEEMKNSLAVGNLHQFSWITVENTGKSRFGEAR